MPTRKNYLSQSVLFLALAGISTASLAAGADDAVPEPTTFVKKAAVAGLTEVEAAKIALAKSQDPSIRSFAQKMVTDHTKANMELSSIASAKGIDAPKKPDAEHQAMLDKLASKSGTEFDREYSQHMNMDHSKAIALFEGASKSSDPELAGFAKKTLPTIKEHKKLAEKLPGKTATADMPGG
jgi:putative membrane protein